MKISIIIILIGFIIVVISLIIFAISVKFIHRKVCAEVLSEYFSSLNELQFDKIRIDGVPLKDREYLEDEIRSKSIAKDERIQTPIVRIATIGTWFIIFGIIGFIITAILNV